MVMRYYFGLGVGHTYANAQNTAASDRPPSEPKPSGEQHGEDLGAEDETRSTAESESDKSSSTDYDRRDDEDESGDSGVDGSDDEELYAMDEIYGFSTTDFE
jgi:hypothetical protein